MEVKYERGRIGFLPLPQDVEVKYRIGGIGFMPLSQDVEAKYGIIFKTFSFSLITPIFEKKNMINLNFHD